MKTVQELYGGEIPKRRRIADFYATSAEEQPQPEQDNAVGAYAIPIVGNILGNAADMATDTVGLGLQGLGAELKGLAVTPDAPAATVGRWISRGGEWLGEQAHTPEREARHTSQRWSGTSFSDILSDPGLFYEYVTDPQGLQAELGAGIGSALTFGALARLFPGAAATGLASKALTPASNLLGSAGLTRMSQALGSNAAKDILGSSLQFGATMAPAGALINAATIIQPLKEQGYSDKEIAERMNYLIGEELPADIAFAALTGNVAKGTLGNALTPKNATTWQKVLANASGIPLEGAGGYYSNAYQMILSDKYSDKPYGTLFDPLPNESAAGRMGVLAGVPFAIPGAYNSYQAQNARENAEQARQERNKRFKEYSDRVGRVTANDDGTDAYDNTPYGDARQAARDIAKAGNNGIDAFMRAIGGQESGGDYDAVNYAAGEMRGKFQIDVNNWAQWAQDAGLSPDAPMTPENQELVARNKMLEYYNKYGNWRDVASMWYSGYPVSDLTEEEYTRPQYAGGQEYPSIKGYVDSIMSRFQEQGGEEARGGNIFGVENYDMPTQGDNITQQVSQLKNGWGDVIPQIGGVLKEKFGLNATISSAARSADHNAEVGGAPNSYHIVRDEGGDALDIVFDRDTTQEEQNRIADYFKGTGLFSEVLYHDVGSGAHLHLGGLKAENLSRGVQFDSRTLTRPSETRRTQHKQTPQEETPKPLFDLNAEDEQMQKLLERFASERVQSLANAENPDRGTLGFFAGLFNEAGEFQNTEANRAALRERYGNEITSWANEILKQESPAQPAAPAKTQSSPKPQGKAKVTKEDVAAATDNFLERLRTDRTNPNTLLELQEARRAGDVAKMESILRQNNVEIAPVESTAPVAPSPQPPVQSENVVQNNQPPENILTSEQETAQPQQETKPSTPKPTKEQKQAQTHINRVSKATNLANKNRNALDNIVNSIQWLAAQNNIVIPAEDLTKLKKRSLKTISKWRDRLTEAGALTVKPAQETTTAPPAPQQTEQHPDAETTATPKEMSLQTALQRARQILDTQEYTPNTHPLSETQQRQDTEQDVFDLIPTTEDDTTTDESESPTRESGAVEEPVAGLDAQRTIEQIRKEKARQEARERELEKSSAIGEKYYGNQSTASEPNEADFRIATAPISTESRAARAEQGRALLRVFYSEPFRDVQLPAGLEQSLERGDTNGIKAAQELLEQRDLADRRRSDTRAGQADEQVLIAQEEDVARRAAQSQHATDTAQQGLMASTNETVQSQREAQQENVTRREQPAQEDDRDVFDLLPNEAELNDVESDEVQTQPEEPTQIEPPATEEKPAQGSKSLHFEKFEDTNMADEPYFGVGIKKDSFFNAPDELSGEGRRELEAIAKKIGTKLGGFDGGRRRGLLSGVGFETAEDRDNFIKAIEQSGFFAKEEKRQFELEKKRAKERAEKQRAEAEKAELEAKLERIINDTKEAAYRILEADKYPEIKNFVDRQLEQILTKYKSLRSYKIADPVEAHEDFAKKFVGTVHKYKDAGDLPDGVLWELFNEKFGLRWEYSNKNQSKADFLTEAINRVKNGEITLDEAYEETKHFLKTGKRKVAGKTSKPKPKRKENKKDKLYEKFQADTHPHIKAHLDELFAKAADKTNRDAQKQALALLKRYEEAETPTEKQLNDIEERFKNPAPRTEQPESAKKNEQSKSTEEPTDTVPAREEPNTESKPKTEPSAQTHKMPKFLEGGTEIKEQDLLDLIDQAWDKGMRAELEDIYNNDYKKFDIKDISSTYSAMKAVFEARQVEENSKTHNGKAPATIDDCKSIDGIADYWRAKYNSRAIFAPELNDLYLPAVKEFLKGTEDVFRLFPGFAKKITRVDAFAPFGAVAQYTWSGRNIKCTLSFNYSDFKSKESVEELIKEQSPQLHKNASATSIGRHEAGHALASALLRRAGYVEVLKNPLSTLSNIHDSALLYWASELLSPTKKDRLVRDELNEERKKISKYAYEGNGSETVAEAIADVLTNGAKAAPLSKAIVQRIKEALVGDTWREHQIISTPFSDFSRLEHKNINTATVAKWYKARIAEISKTPEIEKAREKYNKHKEHGEKTLEAYLDYLNGQVKAGKISSNEADGRYRAKVKTTAEKIAEFAEDFTRISRVHTDYYATKIRKQAEELLYDRGLAEELAKTKSREEWEALLERRTPDEKILEQDGWSDAKINECAKDTHTANVIEQLGGKIKDGKVTFSNAADKAAFTRFMELMIDPNARYDIEGDKGTINTDTSNVVAEKDLTPAQKLLVSFGKKLGVRVVFFDNPDGRFRGVHKEGYSLLNINGNKGLGGVFWHESFHWLKNNNPELYKALVKAAGITDAQRKAYLETSKRTDLKSNEEIDEEILADMMDDVAKRTGLFQSIAGKNRGLIERAIQWFKDTLNKFIDHFRNPQGKLTTAQAQALASEFGRIANQLKDPNGNQIFRYNRRTHNVELANNRERTEAELAEMTAKNAHFEAKYSADSNDNSPKSFKQRLKNLLGVEGKNIPIHKQMKRQLEDLSDMKIAADHLPEGVQVKIDKIAKVIRTGREYDWANILPEVGNAVAKQLGIMQSAEMGNYIGKFILNGAPNDTSAEAKEFAKAMRENTEMRNKVMAIRSTFDTWNNMSAEEQMIASTRYDKEIPPLRERAQKFWQYLRTELFDTQMPIHYHVAKFVKATGIKLSESINPEIAFRNLRGMQQRAMRMVYGNELTKEALQKMYPNVDFSNWKPIAMILESIKAEPSSQRYKQFDQFVKASHFLDIHQHNYKVLGQQNKVRDEIRKLRDELDKADTKKKKAELTRSIKKKEESLEALKQKIMDTPDAYTYDKCADLVLKYNEEFGEAQKDLVQYSRVLLDIMADSGMISRKRYHQMLAAYPNYVPLHREFDENPNLNTADSMKQMLGSAKDIGDSIAAIANNTFDYIQRTEKNKAKLLLANLANFDGVGGIFELVDDSTPNDGTIIHFYENGKRKALQCSDEDIVKAVNTMNQPTMNLFLKVLQVPALMLRATATGLSPGFILGNFLRDPQDAFMVSKRYGAESTKALAKDFRDAFNPLVTGKYMLEAIHMGKLYEEYAVSGAAQSDFFTFDRDYKAEAIERLTKKNYKRFASPKGVIELLGKLGEWSELSTRLRQYDKVKKSRAKEHGGINIYDDLVAAAFESRDFIDFARHGNAGRTWNTLTAFANPVLQGFDKQWRTYDFGKLKKFGGTEETQKEFYTSVARLFLGGVLPALVLSLLHKDDDWYKDDVQDWEKENYWILNEYMRVPKGADVGLRFFSNLTEHLISRAPVRANKVLQPLKGILPDLMPTAFLPIFECMANYDLFRRQPIVPQREINKFKDTPELQYDSTNSKLAVLLGRVTGVSPRYIDHVIYGYTSGFGKEATHLMDTVTPGRHGAWTRSDVPFFSRVLRTPYRAPKIVSEYYEEFGRQESYAQRLAWEKKHGNPNAKPSAEYDPALHRRLKNIQRAMQNLNAAERAIMDDPKLTSEQVEDKREEIQKKRVELCRKAFQRAR